MFFFSEATVEINKVAHHINENIRQRENFQKMLSIQNALTGEGAPKILAPGNYTKHLYINKSLFVMNEGKEYCMLYWLSQKLYTCLHTVTLLQYTAT